MLNRSDINQRLPRFRDALASINDVRNKGGLDSVPQAVLDRLEGVEPIGLDRKRPSNNATWLRPYSTTPRAYGAAG
jgi:hypothetical protein